jgi:hypothetical protein
MPGGTEVEATAESLAKRFNPVLKAEMLPRSAALSQRYGASGDRLFLVRPDGYVAFKARAGEAGLLEAHLGRMLPNR